MKASKTLFSSAKGAFFGIPPPGLKGPEFVRFFKEEKEHAAKSAKMWRNIFFITGVPVIGALSINAYTTEMKHLAHQHEPHFKHLPYLHIRQKPFPWRNGDQSLFFNPGSQAGKEE